ncbi:shikimate dehydrogenase [Acidisoma sp. S159]|uniref:shikimate dehydrogenase n=1 Tax=Acidisoma sp. S159 TaxID=1747225 RepID=UPI00131C663F|nr:shikimate dehydrogenase [Acidisoma sp. S159]
MPILTGHTRLAGVLGWPVSHSRSPRLHGFWLERYGIDGVYLPLPVRPEDFSVAVRGLMAAGFAGANVTLPHKQAAFACCDALEDAARATGAVNTLKFEGGRVIGDNTDGAGFIANLAAHKVEPKSGPALILGAGGAASAIGAALRDKDINISICNRSENRAEALARRIPGARVIDWEARHDALADHTLLVNTTSLGMTGQPPLDLDLSHAAPGMAVADIVYAPLETPLLAAACAAGLLAVGGLGMLLHQAAPGFAAWFGVTPVVDEALYRFVAADLLPAAPLAG